MAVSSELSEFLLVLCNIIKPKRILDLGSGFSSFVFRQYMVNAPLKPDVWSVDDSPFWLEKTHEFLAANSLPNENLITWDLFLKKNVETFDLILYDLGSMDIRRKMISKIAPLINSNGAMVMDDTQFTSYRRYARQIFKECDLDYYSLKFFTRDKYGRYSWFVSH
jgi:predicted O-methyltransferase YrrM